jgi:hypothetical protein
MNAADETTRTEHLPEKYMDSFEISFHRQLAFVLEGKTADGNSKHALWPLPGMHRFDKLRERIIEESLWTLYRLPYDQRDQEDVRTFVIWATAAHMWRLTHKGTILENAAREVGWMSLIMTEKPAFLTTSAFARKLMPVELRNPQPHDRADIRREALDILRICRSRWRPEDHMPFTVAFDTRYSMKAYSTPEHFLANPPLATRWTGHVAAVAAGKEADHTYWAQVAAHERKVYGFFIGDECKATLESHIGNLDRLVIHGPADDVVYDRLAFALAHTTHVTGDTFKLPKDSVNPAVLCLQATNARHVREVREVTARANQARDAAKTEWAPPPTRRFKNTDTFLACIVLCVALSYLVPMAIVAAPGFARNVVYVWRVALGLQPTCTYAARVWGVGKDCYGPPDTAAPSPGLLPIPPHADGSRT